MHKMHVAPELTLTDRAIQRMFGSKMLEETIILQVLHSTKVQHRGLRCCSVVLSDGLHMNSCFMVNKAFSTFSPLPRYALIKVNHYFRSVIETENDCTKVVIEIDSIMLLTPKFTQIQHLVGDPQQFDESSIIQEDVILRTKFLAEKAALTKGALTRIKAGELVEKPVVQVMSAKFCAQTRGKYLLFLSVCDGQSVEHVSCAQPLFQHFSHHIHHLKMSIIQLDKFEFTNGGGLVIDEITWLNWGSHVCFKWGLLPQRATLSTGCIQEWIKYGRLVRDPIVQIVKIRAIWSHSEGKQQALLMLYDGRCYTNAYLSTQLEQSLRGSLTNRCIVRLDVYKPNHVNTNADRRCPFKCSSISICGLTLLNQTPNVDFQWNLMTPKPTLTEDGINRIFSSDSFIKPVVRIIKVDVILNGTRRKYYTRLMIHDGTQTCNAYLPSYMSYLTGYLDKLPIVRLDSYIIGYKKSDQRERKLTILAMTGLFKFN